MRIVALDLGKKRVGLAYANDRIGVVIPLDPFVVKVELQEELGQLHKRVLEYQADLVIVGDPITLDGERGLASEWAHQVGDELGNSFGLDIGYVDERLSTNQGNRALRETGLRGKKLRSRIDSAAAVVILEHYMELRKRD